MGREEGRIYCERDVDVEILEFCVVDGPAPGDEDEDDGHGELGSNAEDLAEKLQDEGAVAIHGVDPHMQPLEEDVEHLEEQSQVRHDEGPVVFFFFLVLANHLLHVHGEEYAASDKDEKERQQESFFFRREMRVIHVHHFNVSLFSCEGNQSWRRNQVSREAGTVEGIDWSEEGENGRIERWREYFDF